MRQFDGPEEEVVDVQSAVVLRQGQRVGYDRFGIGNGHGAGEAHEEVVGVQADGFTDVDAGIAEIVLVVIGGDGLRRQDVEDLLRNVLVGMALHRIDVDMADAAILVGFGITHDVIGDQHHGVPRTDAVHHAFRIRFFIVEVVGKIPFFGQILAQQATGIDVQGFGAAAGRIRNVRQDADAAGEDRFEHERTAAAVIDLAFVARIERLAHVRVLLGQSEFGCHAGTGAAAGTENVEIQA